MSALERRASINRFVNTLGSVRLALMLNDEMDIDVDWVRLPAAKAKLMKALGTTTNEQVSPEWLISYEDLVDSRAFFNACNMAYAVKKSTSLQYLVHTTKYTKHTSTYLVDHVEACICVLTALRNITEKEIKPDHVRKALVKYSLLTPDFYSFFLRLGKISLF